MDDKEPRGKLFQIYITDKDWVRRLELVSMIGFSKEVILRRGIFSCINSDEFQQKKQMFEEGLKKEVEELEAQRDGNEQ